MAFRSSASVPFGSSTATTVDVPVPTGAAVNDSAVVAISTTNDVTSSRSGWLPITPPPYVATALNGRFRWYRKTLVLADLTGPWTFTHSGSGGGSAGWAGVWSGRDVSTNPLDFTFSVTAGNTIAGPPKLGGLAAAGTDVAVFVADYNGNTGISVTGYTQAISNNNGEHLYYLDNASGSVTPVIAGAGTQNNSWWTAALGLRSSSAGPGDIRGPFDLGTNQTATGQFATTLTLAEPVPAGATIVVSVVCTTGMILGCSDSKSGTWTARGTVDTSLTQANNNFIIAAFTCKTASAYAAGDTITVTRTNGVTPNLLLIRAAYFTGVDSIRGTSVTGAGTTSATNGATTTLTAASLTTVAGDRVWGVFGSNATPALSASGVWGQASQDNAAYSTTTRTVFADSAIATGTSIIPTASLTNNQGAARTWGALAFALVPTPTSTPPNEGTATGGILWSGSAAGHSVHRGSASGAVSWAGAASGSAGHEGSATGSLAWSGTATGSARTSGAATGSIDWAGTATGRAHHSGDATGAIGWRGTATGRAGHSGTATGATAWHGTGTGTTRRAGTAAGAVNWSGTATGHAPTVGERRGRAAGAITWAGLAAGSAERSGTASGGISWTGHASGTTRRRGSAAGHLLWAGTASGSARHSGSAAGSVAWAGRATGTAPTIGTNSGNATGTITWAGTAAGSKTPHGTATGRIVWAGTGIGRTDRSGAAVGALAWTGTARGQNGDHPARDITLTAGPITGGWQAQAIEGGNWASEPLTAAWAAGAIAGGGWESQTPEAGWSAGTITD